MNSDFADWLRTVKPEVDNEKVLARWALVEGMSTALSPDDLLALIHFAVTDTPTATFFVEAIQKIDASFPTRDNAAELRLLAAAILINIITSRTAYADATALAMICVNAGGLRRVGPIKASLSIAERHLFERGRDRRAISPPGEVVTSDLKKPLADLTAALPSMAQNAYTPLGEFMSKLIASQSSVAKSANGAVKQLHDDVRSFREQLDIVWWVFGGRLSSGRPFEKVGLPELALLVAEDLNEMTAVIPGPVAMRGYVRFVLQTGRNRVSKVSIKQAIDAVQSDVLSVFETRPATQWEEFICAISSGLHRRHTNGNQSWSAGFDQQIDVDANKKIDAEDIAYQLYCERLFMRELEILRS